MITVIWMQCVLAVAMNTCFDREYGSFEECVRQLKPERTCVAVNYAE